MALEHVQQVTIDFQIPTSIPTPRFVQYDTNVIEFVVKDGGVDADLTDIQRIVVSLRRKDGVLLQQLLEAEGNVVRYELTDEEMNIPGYVDVMLQLYDGVDHITYQTELKLYFEKTIGNEFANGRGVRLLLESGKIKVAVG